MQTTINYENGRFKNACLVVEKVREFVIIELSVVERVKFYQEKTYEAEQLGFVEMKESYEKDMLECILVLAGLVGNEFSVRYPEFFAIAKDRGVI